MNRNTKKIAGVVIKCIRGNIVEQPGIDAVVNAANSRLASGGGVAGAIHRAAGPSLYEERKPLAPIKPGDAVITGAGDLPNKFIIHCLGPVYPVRNKILNRASGSDKPEDRILTDCYKNALMLADENKVSSVAFPAISTGAFGYPFKAASQIAVKTAKDIAPLLKNVKEIRFVFFTEKELEVFRGIMEGDRLKNV